MRDRHRDRRAGGDRRARRGATARTRRTSHNLRRNQDLGAASLAAPILTGQVLGDKSYVVARGLSPAILGIYDMSRDRSAARCCRSPSGSSAWASTTQGDEVYVGTYGPADLYRLDTSTEQLTKVASFPRDAYVFDLTTSPDGKLFAGTYATGSEYEYDPATGAVRNLGVAAAGQPYVRSVAAGATTVYAGVGAHAHLIAIDRASGARRDLLPPELAGESFVYELTVTPDYVIGGTNPSGTLFAINKHDPSDYRIVRPDYTDTTIDTIAVDGDDVYFSSDPTATRIYHYDLSTGELSTLPTEEPGSNHNIQVVGDRIVGFSDFGQIWTYDLTSDQVDVTGLEDAGLHSAPESPQSMADDRSRTVYVGGHGGVQVHDLRSGTSSRFPVAGEPKAMTTIAGRLYMTLYPTGAIARYDRAPNR